MKKVSRRKSVGGSRATCAVAAAVPLAVPVEAQQAKPAASGTPRTAIKLTAHGADRVEGEHRWTLTELLRDYGQLTSECGAGTVLLDGVAPIPWRVSRVEATLAELRVTRVGTAAIEGARPPAKNQYELPMTQAIVKQTLLAFGA